MRKQAHGTQEADNAWRLESIIVLLYEQDTLPLNQSRLFALFTEKGMWFGNEHGHQAWLSEVGGEGPDAQTLMKRLEMKGHFGRK